MNEVTRPGLTEQPATTRALRLIPIARMAVIAIGLLAFGIFAVSLPESIRQASTSASAVQLGGGALGFSGANYALFRAGLDVLAAVAFLIVAVLLMVRRSHDGYVLFVALTMALTAVNYSDTFYAYYVRAWPPQGISLIIGALAALAEITQFATFFTFPDGRYVPRWTRWLTLVWIPYRTFGWMYWYMQPVEVRGLTRSYDLGLQFGLFAVGIAAQLVRFRQATTQEQKQQTKWIVFAMSVATVILLTYVSTVDAFPLWRAGTPRVIFVFSGSILTRLTLALIPLAVAASILRYRLWDIDFIINRSLVYGSLTALLGLLFLASALIVARVFDTLSGGAQSALALVVAGVAFGALFQPTRARLQKLVDRRLYHIEIDYHPVRLPDLAGRGALAGRTLGAYVLLESIGRGGMAEVYKARHVSLNRDAAVKVLPPASADDPDLRRRFEREARLIGQLKHPNIVQLFDFGVADGLAYMAMEYVQGHNLSRRLSDGGALPVEEIRWIIRDIAHALDYAHAEGLVHRDIKPSNIMIEPTTSPGSQPYRAVLMDFGIARLASSLTQLTHTGIVGTLDYISPEQIRDDPGLDGRADIYSLGVMLFQMLTGRLPFTATNPGALLLAHLYQPAPSPRVVRADVPEEVAGIVLRALEKDPRWRPASAGALLAALG